MNQPLLYQDEVSQTILKSWINDIGHSMYMSGRAGGQKLSSY